MDPRVNVGQDHHHLHEGDDSIKNPSNTIEGNESFCWSGSIDFASMTPASGVSISSCNATHVKTISDPQYHVSEDEIWNDISLPKSFAIQGRIEMDKAIEYLKHVAAKCTNRCISVAQLLPGPSSDDISNFDRLYDHLSQKQRYAVIYGNYGKPFPDSKTEWMVKDLYIVFSKGIKSGDLVTFPLPEPIRLLNLSSSIQSGLFLVSVLSKSPPKHLSKHPSKLQISSTHHHKPKRKHASAEDSATTIFKAEPLGEGILSLFLNK